MAKIYEDKQIFKWQPSVWEMADHMVLGGQVHDKATLAPIPFTTIGINSYSKQHLIGRNSWVRETDGSYEGVGNATWLGGADEDHSSFALDNNDSSIGYIICPRDDGNSVWAHKINMNTFELLSSYETDLGSSGDRYAAYYDYPGQYYIFSQDNDYIYTAHKHRDIRRQHDNSTLQPVGEPDIEWFSKATMAKVGEYAPISHLRTQTYVGKVGTTHFYAHCDGYWNNTYIQSRNRIIIYKFDTASKVGASVVSHDEGTTFNSMGQMSRPFAQGSDVMHSYWTTRSDLAEEGYNIYKVETDMQGETATVSGCTYDWNGYTRADEITRHDVNDRHHRVTTFTTDDGSNQYVNFLVTETAGQWDNTLDCMRIHTFLIGGDGSALTYKGSLNPGFRMRGIMNLEDDFTKFIIFGDSHSEIYTWNDQTETYVETSTVNIQCYAAMTDSLNRLWMTDEANNVHLLSSFSPLTITVVPENADYNYAGSTINTYVNVSAYDIDMTRMATNVRLVLEGSTYFTDDSQVKEIVTSTGGETQVNIKITGTSFTRILASVVV